MTQKLKFYIDNSDRYTYLHQISHVHFETDNKKLMAILVIMIELLYIDTMYSVDRQWRLGR